MRVEENGVWDHHCQIEARDDHRIALISPTDAISAVNGQPTKEAILRNGDIVQLGALQLQFSLSPTTHRGLRFRETMTWVCLAAITLGQVALIYALAVEL